MIVERLVGCCWNKRSDAVEYAIRVLFTDIDMPGSMNGIDLAARVRDQWPPTVILVTSGIVGLTKDTLPDGARFFPKPYSANHIIGTLARIAADLGRG